MSGFLLFRLTQSLLSILAVLTLVFFLVRASGDPLELLVPPEADEKDREEIAASLGFDAPLPIQFVRYMAQTLRGDLGESLFSGRPVMTEILQRLPATLQLGGAGILISLLVALPLGVYSAVHRGRPLDWIGRGFAFLGQSSPSFWVGIILIQLFAVVLGWFPAGGRGGLWHLVLPSFTMGWFVSAGILRMTRSSMLEVLGSEYVKLARSKGLNESVVVWKHAFKNALLPIMTFSSMLFVIMLTGSIVTETVFAWPGVGRLIFDAIYNRDYPLVQGCVLLLSVLYIVANFFVDIMYACVNPKIRYQ